MKQLIALLIIMLPMSVAGRGPNSINRGFNVGLLTYSYLWNGNQTHANNTADMFDVIVGGGDNSTNARATIDYLVARNPDIEIFRYETTRRGGQQGAGVASSFANDSALIRNRVGSDANFRKLFMIALGNVSVDCSPFGCNSDAGTTDPCLIGPNSYVNGDIIQPEYFANNQHTYVWDLREYKAIAGVMAYVYFTKYFAANAQGYSGPMIDEESHVPTSAFNSFAGLNTQWYPFAGASNWPGSSHLSVGNPSKSPDWHDGGLSFLAIGDSIAKLRNLYWAALRDSMALPQYGSHIYMSNFGGNLDAYSGGNNNRWNAQGLEVAKNNPWVLFSEFTDNMPMYWDAGFNPWQWFSYNMHAMRNARNENISLFFWGSRILPSDTTGLDTTISIGHVKMVHGAQAWLMMFPGTAKFAFAVARARYKVDWSLYANEPAREYCCIANCGTASPTLQACGTWGPEIRYCYDTAWAAYPGVPTLERDSVSGTDGRGNAYRIYSGVFLKPASVDTQSLVIFRPRRGQGIQGSAVNFTIPGSASRTWTQMTSDRKFGATFTGGQTIKVINGHGIFLTSDPALTVAGSIDTALSIATAVSSTELNSGTHTVNVRVTMANGPRQGGQNTTFNVSTIAGTATSGVDYQAQSSVQYTITGGQTFVDIPVTIISDVGDENDETFTVRISGVAPSPNVSLTAAIDCTVTIIDDDVPITTVDTKFKGMHQP